jgi:hypothetical protein
MKIRYDANGNILAVGDDSCDWPGRVLSIAERDAPDDLLATFALGKYVVRDGKLAKVPARTTTATSPAKLLGIEPDALDLAVFAPGALPTPSATTGPATAKPAGTGAAKHKRVRPGPRAAKTARVTTASKPVGGRLGRAKRGKG